MQGAGDNYAAGPSNCLRSSSATDYLQTDSDSAASASSNGSIEGVASSETDAVGNHDNAEGLGTSAVHEYEGQQEPGDVHSQVWQALIMRRVLADLAVPLCRCCFCQYCIQSHCIAYL